MCCMPPVMCHVSLHSIDIECKLLELFTSYLQNRKQIVVVDGLKISTTNISAGLPQGSRLGPLLFIIYINDITKDLESDILIFADDCSLLVSDINPNTTAQLLNGDLVRISQWASKWKVKFNGSKKKDMIFSKKVAESVNPLKLNDLQVTQVSQRHLGLQITHNLDRKEQVSNMCLRANCKLSVLRQLKQLQISTFDLLYKTTVRSIINYGILVYYHLLTQADKNRIDKLQ